jgi:hypothetical protein
MVELNPVLTPMSTATTLDPDENGEAIDQREYRSMIGSPLYLIQHGWTQACVNPNEHGNNAGFRWKWWGYWSKGIQKHDWLPPVPHGDTAGHLVHCVPFQASPRSSHQTTIQQIFRYLKYTLKFGIWYSASSSLDLVSFFDADFAGCGIDQKSTSSICHFLGSSLVYWSTHKQSFVAQSTTEAEYVATAPRFFG